MKVHVSRNTTRIILAAITVMAVIAVILFGVRIWDRLRQPSTTPDDGYLSDDSEKSIVYMDGVAYTPKPHVGTVLFLGVDTYEADEAYADKQQADALLLLAVDNVNRCYTAIPINRDTMATFEMLSVTGESAGDMTAQIALSHTYGSGGKDSIRNTIHAVSNLLYGVELRHYISMQMDAVPLLNDAVGGVTLDLLDDFTMLDPSFNKGQTVTLHGEQALAYVQERGALTDSSNVSRMQRQEQYLTAFKQSFFEARDKNEQLLSSLTTEVSDYVLTDLTVNQLDELANCLETYSAEGFVSIQGESVVENGHMAFYADEEALQRLVVNVFYEPAQ